MVNSNANALGIIFPNKMCIRDRYELNRYTSDGTHPNREGAAKMAAYVTNALLAPEGF